MDMEIQKVENAIVLLRGCRVIHDYDVAELYGIETKRVNEAVKNNPDKFPDGYVMMLTRGQHRKYLPKAFTGKGLYMLATILKSPMATQTTIAIVETFARLKELSRAVSQISGSEDQAQHKTLEEKCGMALSALLDNELEVYDTETAVEVNLAMLKFRHVVKRKNERILPC